MKGQMKQEKPKKERREVKIVLARGTYFVEYVKRSKHQKYCAGQFNDQDSTLTEVEKWCEEKGYKLVKD